jgi:hypothetical protein
LQIVGKVRTDKLRRAIWETKPLVSEKRQNDPAHKDQRSSCRYGREREHHEPLGHDRSSCLAFVLEAASRRISSRSRSSSSYCS